MKTILFIEDEAELLQSVTQLLREQEYTVVSVTRAEDALDHLLTLTPDLILADIKLPGIDGFDFFNHIKSNDDWKNIPVVFLTAFNNMEAMAYAKKIGVKEYITKPFEFEYLITRIRTLLAP